MSDLKLCPFCGGDKIETVFKGAMPIYLSALPMELSVRNKIRPIKIALCRRCSLGFNQSPLESQTLNDIYDNYMYIDPFNNIGDTPFVHIIDMIAKHSRMDDKVVEIGSSVGFLLHSLHKRGYTNLLGVDPSPQSEYAAMRGLNIRKKYYDSDDFDNDVDLFILRHVFEHFEDPFAVFKNMVSHINGGGKIIIETPYFGGFHHQHLFFYSRLFYANLASAFGLSVIDYKIYDGNIIAAFSKRKRGERNSLCCESVEELAQKARSERERLDRNVQRIKDFLSLRDVIYWWGTGSFSSILLSELTSLRGKQIIPVDTDHNRKGMSLANLSTLVLCADDLIGLKPDALAIASSLREEIKNAMRARNISPKAILEFD
ncbi:MAG: class I SAM-dependent methyltransferase [Helicobacteraceae bacterium]|nr:class I SAM-dependent methyltransferase [Helicobacteraceae bacterium]